ncbi:hypothetical protein MWH25_02420 [Natroniella acetigena]|uniref:hypothetical protein n=1 Tax=Natroniella acetigena TaxID=52004 RepID=UPI00200B3F1B|nr:hypothetical protein [Natroniella acetigena]MCK8826604.1 hypothetical protein [Natroniella acetigena]
MECKDCGKKLDLDWQVCPWCSTKVEVSEKDWPKRIYDDNSLWYEPAFEEFPEIIAGEYKRLRNLFKNGQTFGALLQIKDLFEILLKLPTYTLLSQLHHQESHNEAEKKIFRNLLRRNLSLGTIKSQAEEIIKLDNLDSEIVKIEKSILDIYNRNSEISKKSIVKWRNDQIGHGALGFDNDSEFRRDIEEKLTWIREHLLETEKIYSNTELIYKQENEETDSYLSFKDKEYKIAPYIIYKKDKSGGRFYFFDKYINDRKQSAVLDYVRGNKFKENTPEIARLYNLYMSLVDRGYNSKQSSSTDSDIISNEILKLLDEVAKIKSFTKPDLLGNWLKDRIEKNNKGLFLLQMEAGMGKTTFVRALDQLELNKFKNINNELKLISRAYYINDSFAYQVGFFTSGLWKNLTQDITVNLAPLSENKQNKSKNSIDFANKLGDFLKLYSQHDRTEKLLFIIDGLDEIPAQKDKEQELSIFDFIPRNQDLPENVYILLTSRIDEELENYHQEQISELDIKDDFKLSVKKEDGKNICLIQNYVKNHLKITGKDEIEEFLAAADYKLLYLSLFKTILDSKNVSLEELKKANNKFEAYFDLLRSMYGEKLFNKIKIILAIIATSYEPLTAKEISYLLGEEELTFRFLAILSDLKPLLKVERSNRGNSISLFHYDLKVLIKKQFGTEINDIIKKWQAQVLEIKPEEIDCDNSTELYLLSYIVAYLVDYLEYDLSLADFLKGESTEYDICKKINNFIDKRSGFILKYRLQKFSKNREKNSINRKLQDKTIENILQEKANNRYIRLTSRIEFDLAQDNSLLKIKMSKDGVKAHMQESKATFEAWAIIIKSYLEEIRKVQLSWEEPEQEENKHYQRFLYRVKNFEEMYPWFKVLNADYKEELLLDYKSGEEFLINSFGDMRKVEINNKNLAEGNEKDLEYYLSSNKDLLSNIFNTEFKYVCSQLPVGIYKNSIFLKNRLLPGGSSAIDFFGTDDDTTYIFELKVDSKMLGIISQIYCYAFLIKDIQNGNLKFKEKDYYLNNIKKTDKLKAIISADVFHPLIDNQVLAEMNKQEIIDFKALMISINGITLYRR